MASVALTSPPINLRERVTFCGSCLRRYKARNILNWQVTLVIFWNFLFWTVSGLPSDVHRSTDIVSGITSIPVYSYSHATKYILYLLPILLWVISTFFCAWLVGWKYRLQDVVFAGMILSCLGVFINTAAHAAAVGMGEKFNETRPKVVIQIGLFLTAIGSGPIVTNLFQLAVEQIPGASASQISSLVSWFIFSSVLGNWSNSLIIGIFENCMHLYHIHIYRPYLKLFFATIMTIMLCTNVLFKNKLYDNSPTSNTTRKIYEVLKYALKHKHPENRSALTYWEEKPPSRLNLGKRKYGGPFTNEQVEDVRTFIQISALCLTSCVYLSTLYLNGYSLYYLDNYTNTNASYLLVYFPKNKCTQFLYYQFVGYYLWWMLITILVYELIVVPLVYYKMPNMMHRVGFCAFLLLFLSLCVTILVAVHEYSSTHHNFNNLWLALGMPIPVGALDAIFYISALEFICAQSPYTMRNFFVCVAVSISWSSPLIPGMIFALWKRKCSYRHCPIIYSTVALALCFLALVIFFISAKLYHKRTRGHEDEHQQRWVEEIYDKYVAYRRPGESSSLSCTVSDAKLN